MTKALHRTDLELSNAVRDELQWTPGIGSQGIVVTVADGKVTLSGHVATYPELLLAARAVQRVRGVTALVQAIVVKHGPNQVNDLDIGAQAAEALMRAVDVPESVRASADAGVITLSGEAEWQYEREAAARSVRHLKGVGSVHNRITLTGTVSSWSESQQAEHACWDAPGITEIDNQLRLQY